MTKILLAVDGSSHALRATRKLLELAGQWKERPQIVPIHVHLPLPRAGAVRSVVGGAAMQRYYREVADKALAPTLKLLQKSGHSNPPVLLIGPIAESIATHARRNKFDLICLGTRGMTATANLLLGSVATKVLHLADVPVITVR